MDDILQDKDYAGEQAKIQKLGENHVYFLPYLMGERSPHNDPDARGTFIGMTMDTSREDMTQAVLEGVAFALRDSLEVDVIESEEGPGLGAAMLAAVACGEYGSVEDAANKIVKVVDTVEPDPELAARYERQYQKFKQIYPACKELFKEFR